MNRHFKPVPALSILTILAVTIPALAIEPVRPVMPIRKPPPDDPTFTGQFPPLPVVAYVLEVADEEIATIKLRMTVYGYWQQQLLAPQLAESQRIREAWKMLYHYLAKTQGPWTQEYIRTGNDDTLLTSGAWICYWQVQGEQLRNLLGPADWAAGRMPLPLSLR